MKRQSIIKKFYSGLLLLVFLAAITPRPVLHDIFTNHSHSYTKMDGAKEAAINKVGFGCDCNKLTALSPFVSEEQVIASDKVVYSVLKPASRVHDYFSIYSITTPSRGPPAIA